MTTIKKTKEQLNAEMLVREEKRKAQALINKQKRENRKKVIARKERIASRGAKLSGKAKTNKEKKEREFNNELKRLQKYDPSITSSELKKLQRDAKKAYDKQTKLQGEGYLIGDLVTRYTKSIRSIEVLTKYRIKVKNALKRNFREVNIKKSLNMFLDNLQHYVHGAGMDDTEELLYEEIKEIFNEGNFNKLKEILNDKNGNVDQLNRMVQILYYESDQESLNGKMGLRNFQVETVLRKIIQIIK